MLPIGGADMPVVISLLNAFTGLSAAAAGFALDNVALIVAGTLVGSSGTILTMEMATAMNRSVANVLFAGFGGAPAGGGGGSGEERPHVSIGAQDAAIKLAYADSVVIVPGYGLAVAQAQHAIKEVADELEKRGVTVNYAIHPVAGRMPGHMNVLLAEADVPYEQLREMEDINPEMPRTDVAWSSAPTTSPTRRRRTTPTARSPGCRSSKSTEAQQVIVIKRSLSPGFAGIDNDLFYEPNTSMLFADAKQAAADIAAEIAEPLRGIPVAPQLRCADELTPAAGTSTFQPYRDAPRGGRIDGLCVGGRAGQGLWSGLGLPVLIARRAGRGWGAGSGDELARALASRMLCAVSMADGCGDEPVLIAAYGDRGRRAGAGGTCRRSSSSRARGRCRWTSGAAVVPPAATGRPRPGPRDRRGCAGHGLRARRRLPGGVGAARLEAEGARLLGSRAPATSTSSTGSITPTRPPCAACRSPGRGLSQDDWEGVQIRIGPDGRVDERASSHNGYNYAQQRRQLRAPMPASTPEGR